MTGALKTFVVELPEEERISAIPFRAIISHHVDPTIVNVLNCTAFFLQLMTLLFSVLLLCLFQLSKLLQKLISVTFVTALIIIIRVEQSEIILMTPNDAKGTRDHQNVQLDCQHQNT